MKIKLDENLSVRLKGALAHLGHDTDTVHDERLTGKSDDDVLAAAQADERFFVTLDQDFCDARKYPPGTHAGVLVARLPDSEQYRAAEYVFGWFEQDDPAAWSGCFVPMGLVAFERELDALRHLVQRFSRPSSAWRKNARRGA